MSQYDTDLEVLRQSFGDDAEMVMRGISVASTELDATDAVAFVLETMHLRSSGGDMDELQARVAEAMWPPSGTAIADISAGPLARLAVDVRTSLGSFRAGTQVRVVNRVDDDRIFIQVFDRNQTVFPVEESALAPFTATPSTREGHDPVEPEAQDEESIALADRPTGKSVDVAELRTEGARLRVLRVMLEIGEGLRQRAPHLEFDQRYESETGRWDDPGLDECVRLYNLGPPWEQGDWATITAVVDEVARELDHSLNIRRLRAPLPPALDP
jgi:hypothetical protein